MTVENALAIIVAYENQVGRTAEMSDLLQEARTAVWERAETIRLGRRAQNEAWARAHNHSD